MPKQHVEIIKILYDMQRKSNYINKICDANSKKLEHSLFKKKNEKILVFF